MKTKNDGDLEGEFNELLRSTSAKKGAKGDEKDLVPFDRPSLPASMPNAIQRYIYAKNICKSPHDAIDRTEVVVERQLTTHWIVVESDPKPGTQPQRFTVIPHQDLLPVGAALPDLISEEERIDINTCTSSDLLKRCKGLSVCAHILVDRRPKTLYTSWAHVKQLNSDLGIDWAGLQSAAKI